MNLYSIVTSERASKSQGGNKEIAISLFVGDAVDSRLVGQIKLKKELDGYSIIADVGGYKDLWGERFEIKLNTKGEKQKGECQNKDTHGNACYDCESGHGMPCGSTKDE